MFKSTSGKSHLLLRGMPPQCLVSDLCFNATQHPIQTGQCFLPHPNLILYEIMLCIVLQTTTVVIAILYSLVLVTASRRHPRTNRQPTHRSTLKWFTPAQPLSGNTTSVVLTKATEPILVYLVVALLLPQGLRELSHLMCVFL